MNGFGFDQSYRDGDIFVGVEPIGGWEGVEKDGGGEETGELEQSKVGG